MPKGFTHYKSHRRRRKEEREAKKKKKKQRAKEDKRQNTVDNTLKPHENSIKDDGVQKNRETNGSTFMSNRKGKGKGKDSAQPMRTGKDSGLMRNLRILSAKPCRRFYSRLNIHTTKIAFASTVQYKSPRATLTPGCPLSLRGAPVRARARVR